MAHKTEAESHQGAQVRSEQLRGSIDRFIQRYDNEDLDAMCRFCDGWPIHAVECPLPHLKRAQRRLS